MKNNLNKYLDDLLSDIVLPTDEEIKRETNSIKVSNGLKQYFGNAYSRFFSNITKIDNGCWIYNKRWIIDDNGVQLIPKNYSAIIHNIDYPSGCLKTICGNKKCVNPIHLKDFPKEQQALETIAKRKLLKGDNHPKSKLSESDIKKIKIMYSKLLKEKNGKSKGIATLIHKKYSHISLSRICQILK